LFCLFHVKPLLCFGLRSKKNHFTERINTQHNAMFWLAEQYNVAITDPCKNGPKCCPQLVNINLRMLMLSKIPIPNRVETSEDPP
jgi:hypothetical protein